MREIKKIVVELAEIYGVNMSEIRLNAYVRPLAKLREDQLIKARDRIVGNPKITRMPLPAQIIEAANPAANPRAKAIESLDRIKSAIRKFGWPQAGKAKEFLSEQEWRFIERRGGWGELCGNPSLNINDPSAYAQMRDALESENQHVQLGIEGYALPESEKRQIAEAREQFKMPEISIKSLD